MPLRNLTIFGVPNHGALPYATYGNTSTVGIVPAGLETSYLKTEEPTELARINTLDPLDTQWTWNFVGGQTSIGMGLVNHNLYKGSQIRWMSPVSSTTYVYKQKAPNATTASSNITGTFLDVDEFITPPDGNAIAPTNVAQSWYAQFGFSAFIDTPNLGTDLACIVLRSKRTLVTGTELTAPMIVVDLYESGGGYIRTLGYRGVRSTSSGGQIYVFSFDFSELSNVTGADLEIRVTGTPGVNTASGTASFCNLEVLRVYYESQSDYSSPFTYDSGWRTVLSTDSVSTNLMEPTKSDHYIPLAKWDTTSGVIAIRSDQSDHEPPLSFGLFGSTPVSTGIGDSSTYIQAGVAPIGNGITLSIGITDDSIGPSSSILIEDVSSGFTLGGQSYAASTWRRRYIPPTSVVVTRDELLFLQQLAWTRGHSGAVYVVLEPDIDSEYQKFTSFWATIKELGEPSRINYDPPRFRVDISFEEKL